MKSKRTPAPSPVEIEAKVRVASFIAIKRRMLSAGGRRLVARTLETNTLFDGSSRSLAAAGKSFRVRRYGALGSVTLKGPARVEGGLKSRIELETQVTSPEVLTEILLSLGFLPQFRYEKFREVWSLGGAAICLDETPLGRFVEIEGSVTAIHRAARLLGLEARNFLTASYPGLWFAAGRTDDMTFKVKTSGRTGKPRA